MMLPQDDFEMSGQMPSAPMAPPMGMVASMRNQLQARLDYGNPVLDSPPIEVEAFSDLTGPSASGYDMGAGMGMGDMGGGGMSSMGDMGMPPDQSMAPPDDAPPSDMMALLQQKAMARKAHTDKFQSQAMANKSY